jgi:hypothetical protein
MGGFSKNSSKLSFAYMLTPIGVAQKDALPQHISHVPNGSDAGMILLLIEKVGLWRSTKSSWKAKPMNTKYSD